jgi:hypothetical protein
MALRITTKQPRIKWRFVKRLLSFGKPIAITRSRRRYMDEMGWEQSTRTSPAEWHGYYRTRFGSYKGRIIASTPPQYYIYKPPRGLKERHSHSACFSKFGEDGWYSSHFSIPPKDLDSGVIKLERVLCEAYLLTGKTS